MGVGASRFLSEEDVAKGRSVLHTLGGYLREEAGIKEKRDEASLGVVRLDYNYPPAPGDIDCPKSFGYKVHYRVVPGLTFEMCQSGVMTPAVKAEFAAAVRFLDEVKHVNAITGGFMFWFQELARKYTDKPVLMSSLVALPSITTAFAHHEQVAIMTANGKTLAPMHDLITKWCGVDVTDNRYVIVGCEDVPGFEAVERGEKVDVVRVQPGIVDLMKQTIAEYPGIRAILLECTELPPYADALRYATGLPVYDAITTSDMFVDGFLDNPRFGLDGWMHMFDGKQHKYKLGVELTADDKVKCEFCNNNLVYEVEEKAEKPPKWYKPHRYVKQAIDNISGKVGSPARSRNASPTPPNDKEGAHAAHLQGASGAAS